MKVLDVTIVTFGKQSKRKSLRESKTQSFHDFFKVYPSSMAVAKNRRTQESRREFLS